jgi:hypothetical protein
VTTVAIETKCPNCGQEYNLAASQLGKTVSCRSCKEPFTVHEPRRDSPGRDDRDEGRSSRGRDDRREDDRRRRDDDYDRPRRRGGRDDDYDDDRRGRGRRDDDEDDRRRGRRDAEDDERPLRRRRNYQEEDDELDEELPRGRSGGGSWLPLIIGVSGGGVLLLIVVIVIVVLCLPSGPRPALLTKENVAKCKLGMTQGEVEAILGPGKDVSDQLGRAKGKVVAGPFVIEVLKRLEWTGNGHKVTMDLMGGKVIEIQSDF